MERQPLRLRHHLAAGSSERFRFFDFAVAVVPGVAFASGGARGVVAGRLPGAAATEGARAGGRRRGGALARAALELSK